MSKKFKSIRILLFLVGGWFLVVQVAAWITGVPLFEEFRDRARRVAEQTLPVKPVGERARIALGKKLAAKNLDLGSNVFVRIFKQEAELEIWMRDGQDYRLLHAYPICKHSGFLGPKLKEGDKQAPEGFYVVTKKQLNPGSRHYRAFNIGFPNEYDRAHGRTGSALMVHGGCTSVGCYAMTDLGIGEIYRLVDTALHNGQPSVPVHIFPFRMTRKNISAFPRGKWTDFWNNLKTGHDLFEQTGSPPRVGVCGKKYAFGKAIANCQRIAGW